VPLRRRRADHLDHLYESLTRAGGRGGDGLAPKTIHEVHMILHAALDQAVERERLQLHLGVVGERLVEPVTSRR
jgi:integrase